MFGASRRCARTRRWKSSAHPARRSFGRAAAASRVTAGMVEAVRNAPSRGGGGRLLAGILLDMIGNEAKCRHLVRVPSGQGIRIRMNCRRHASYGFVLTSIQPRRALVTTFQRPDPRRSSGAPAGWCLALLFAVPSTAFAYLDPGAAGILIQGVIAADRLRWGVLAAPSKCVLQTRSGQGDDPATGPRSSVRCRLVASEVPSGILSRGCFPAVTENSFVDCPGRQRTVSNWPIPAAG